MYFGGGRSRGDSKAQAAEGSGLDSGRVGGMAKTMECREQDSRSSIGVVGIVDVCCGGEK